MRPARLLEIVRSTPRTRLLRLRVDGAPLRFRAGQAVFAGLAGATTRVPYSIASPPSLADSGALDLLVNAEGAFGQSGVDPLTLVGQTVDLEGPLGTFGVPDEGAAAPLLLVAGGTGIAPIRSVVLDRLDRGVQSPMTLVYSARTPDEFAFGDELLALGTRGVLEVHLTVTRDDSPGPAATRAGRVNDALLQAALPAPDAWCLVCGPAGFVQSATASLAAIGVPESRIVIER